MVTRREFMTAIPAVAVAHTVTFATDAKPGTKFTGIDVHTHFYDPTRKEGIPWPSKDDKVLYRPVLPAEFKKLAAPHGITATVVVEASPVVEDNQWLLDQAKENAVIVGVVGRLFLSDADFAKNLARFAKNPAFRGIRVNESELRTALKDDKQLDRVKALSDNGLSLDLNGGHDTFILATRLADKFPKLRIVVNHMGNPLIDGMPPAMAWKKAVALAGTAGENVYCKLSALVDGTRKRDAAPTELRFYTPVLDEMWTAFGANRLLFGSNWPVSDLYAKYETVHALAHKFIESKDKTALPKVFGTNATKAYQLG
jgi:L-fuconolactonase